MDILEVDIGKEKTNIDDTRVMLGWVLRCKHSRLCKSLTRQTVVSLLTNVNQHFYRVTADSLLSMPQGEY